MNRYFIALMGNFLLLLQVIVVSLGNVQCDGTHTTCQREWVEVALAA